jgi:hypothetical protein
MTDTANVRQRNLFESGLKNALFSPCRKWRYSLHRTWDQDKPFCAFVGLNPSTADESKNDPTVTRCIRFSKDWGFGGFVMVNLFGWRSTDPAGLLSADDPIGQENDLVLVDTHGKSGMTVAAWGVNGNLRGRDREVLSMLKKAVANKTISCLGLTAGGFPRHPLYVPACKVLEPYCMDFAVSASDIERVTNEPGVTP